MIRVYVISLLVVFATACTTNGPDTGHSANHNSNTGSTSARLTNADDHSHHGEMDHAMKSSPGASTAPMELQFLDTMIVHHQGAVDMAKLVDMRAEHAELKKLAANIIKDQEGEIALMKSLRNKWFGEKAEAVNMEFPGMAAGMGGMDLKKLKSLEGNAFDVEFIRQMTPHHQGAIEMAKHVRATDSYAELKKLSDDIIKTQEAEINQMRQWLEAWEKPQ